jgi:polyphosphate kinase 2
MKKKKYLEELDRFSVELALLQRWVRETGQRIVIVFEGRDAAGKGGIIKAITRTVSPRVFRVVALPKPNDREKTQLYFQRYMAQMPAAGEVILFDRSWYNRAMVEPVMGFCTQEQTDRFLQQAPRFESYLVDSGIMLLKYWLEISADEQARQLQQRIDDPAKRWKLSGIDIEGRRRWYAYSRARDRMLEATDTGTAPWYIVPSDDKRRARLNCISHMLSSIPYAEIPRSAAELPPRNESDAYDDAASLARRRFVPDRF